MISHAPDGYACPFCRNVNDGTAEHPLVILYRDDDVFVKMNPKWWPNNPGNVLVIPVAHHENIFDLPAALATPIQRAAQAAAIAMKRPTAATACRRGSTTSRLGTRRSGGTTTSTCSRDGLVTSSIAPAARSLLMMHYGSRTVTGRYAASFGHTARRPRRGLCR